MTRAMLVVVAAIAGMCLAAQVSAEPYGARVVGVAENPPDLNMWSYTLTNSSSSPDYAIWLFQIDVDYGAFVLGATAPPGWIAYYEHQNPNHYVSWMTSSPYLQASNDLSGFHVTYSSKPDQQGWSAQLISSNDPEGSFNDSGEVVTVEPGGFMALLSGMMSVTVFAIRRRPR